MNHRCGIGWIVSIVALLVVFGSAAAEGHAAPAIAPSGAAARDGKLSFRLALLAHSAPLRALSAAAQAQTLGLAPDGPGSLERDAQGRVLVEIRTGDTSAAFQRALRDSGAQIVHVSERYATIAAFVDAAQLTALEGLPALQNIQESLAPIVGHVGTPASSTCPQGTSVSEGDTQLRTALARSTYSLDGTGVQVGVLSDSFNSLGGASADVASGDLPGSTNTCGYTTPVNVLFDSGTTDEGRAMTQIVHDLAPGATLSFATANNTQIIFADHIRALKTAGANVIVDDVIYFAEPYFQDGQVTVGISDVVRTGALYFTAATNVNVIVGGNNVASNEAPAYRPTACATGVPGYEASCHNFNPSGGTQSTLDFTLLNGNAVRIVLQYAEPWYGLATDLDLFLINNSGSLITSSVNNNLSTEQPFEFIYHQNTSGSTETLHIAIGRYTGGGGGTATPRLKVVLFTNCNCGIGSVSPSVGASGDVVGPTIMGHTASHDAFSLAAAPYNDDNNPEGYSARGPAAHYFGPVVNTTPAAAIPTEMIQQPDFTATDGGCNTFFGGISGCHRFYGTSAAAPHAAAIAALLRQKANALGKPLTRGIAKLVLQASARSMSGGNLNSVGAGLLDANAAVAKLLGLKWLFLPMLKR
jgi:Subtilase family